MKRWISFPLAAGLALATLAAVAPGARAAKPAAPAIDPSLLQALEWRSIGPYRGGRVTAVAGVTSEPSVFYFGATGGGIWKTTDAGARWTNLSDGQLGTGSVGALAVAESDPNVIYAGMGEACIRGNVSHGDGVYRSTDAGKTWTNLGLQATRQIGRIRVHPSNPDLVYVAALGHTFGPNAERGVYRSRDGGKSWDRVLFVDDKTVAVDLAVDPRNPRILYAAFWQAQRTPWSLESGGPGSGLYKSLDGGESWEKLTGEGLPKKGVWGRIGVAVSGAKPDRVWAVIEAEDGGVFRSDDAGKTWTRLNEERKLRQRAWYYTHVYADPKNADTVYVLNTAFFRSQDGGKTFTSIPVPHGDNHDLWIAPTDSQRMIGGDDGGAMVSLDGGLTWSRQDNQPTAQMYHLAVDDQFPYRIYGAQQDNSTVSIPSRSAEAGIDATQWYDVGGCESGYVAPRPDGEVVFAGCYDGYISRWDRRTGQTRNVTVYPDNPMGWGAEGMKYRFQWTFPIVISPHDPGTVYAAGNLLFKSTNDGQSWQAISPDLTRNDPKTLGPSGGPITKDNTSVEYYGTIFALAESRLSKGLLWAGSDDGLVHLSRDGGVSWANVTPKDLPEWSLVSQVEPSPHDPGTLYLAVNRYKLDDYRPYIYATRDYGKTWRKLVDGIPEGAFVRVVREDPERKGLLYAGTETGVYVSFDSGEHWQSLQLKLPVVPVTDLVVKDRDLVASTQGRSFWILDDLSPLRQLYPELAKKPAHLFAPRPAYRFFGGSVARPGMGPNPPNGAIVYYTLAAAPKEGEEVTIEFLDAGGKSIRKFSSQGDPEEEPSRAEGRGREGRDASKVPAKPGLNRFAWDLRHPDASRFKGMILWAGGVRGPVVTPGTYQVRLTAGGAAQTQSFELRKDPRLAVSPDDYQRQLDLSLRIRDQLSATHDAVKRIRELREQVKAALERAKLAAPAEQGIADAGEALLKKITAVEEALYQTKNQSDQDPLNFPIRLNNKLASLAGVVGSADAAPTAQAEAVYADLAGRIDEQLAALKSALETDLAAFNDLVREKKVPAVAVK